MKKLLFLTIVSLLAGGAAGCSTCGEGCSLTRLFNRERDCGCHTCNHCGEGCNSCGAVEGHSGCGCSSCGGEFAPGESTIIESPSSVPTPATPRPGTVIPGPDSYSFMSSK